MKKTIQRATSLLLSIALLAGNIPASVFAEDNSRQGLCPHHQTHEGCGYVAAVTGAACGHIHDDSCYQVSCAHVHGDCSYAEAVPGVECDHQHDSACGYAAAVEEIPCTCQQEVHTEDCAYQPAAAEAACSHVHGDCSYAEAQAEVPCDHDCSKTEACGGKVLACSHTHDSSCGYVAAVEGKNCGFVCQDCAVPAEEPEAETEPEEDAPMGSVTEGNIATGTPDGKPPVLNGITLSVSAVKVPAEIEVIVDASDEVAGVEYGEIWFECATTGKSLSCYVSGGNWEWNGETEEWVPYPDGKLHGTLSMDQYVEDGVFVIDQVYLKDKAGNGIYYHRENSSNLLPDQVKAVSFTVVDTKTPDSIPPVLKDVSVSVKKVDAPGTVEVIVDAVDEVSGISSGTVYFYCKDTQKRISCYVRGGNWEWDGVTEEWVPYADGKLHGTLELNQYVETGTFVIDYIRLMDVAENEIYYHSNDAEDQFPDSIRAIEVYVFNTVPDVSTSVSKPSFVEEVKEAEADAYIAADYSGNATMPKEAFEAIAGTDKVIDLVSEGITWRFEGTSITEEIKDVDLNVQIRKVEEDDSASGEAIEETLKNNPGIVMEFPENGNLPGKATIQLKVDYAMRDYLGSETGLYVYYYNNETGKLELIEGDVRVVNDTYVEFTITHCSYYVLTVGHPDEVIPKPGGSCGENLYWEFWEEDGSLRFTGYGAMENYSAADQAPWYELRNDIRRVTFSGGATSLSAYAFCGYPSLTDFQLPSSMTELGKAAFRDCTALESIYTSREDFDLLGKPISFPEELFQGCTSLRNVKIPRTVTRIERNAFRGCTSLDCLDISENVTVIGSGAFADCTALNYILFEGERPEFGVNKHTGMIDAFEGTSVTVYYRTDLSSWDSLDPGEFSGQVNWVGYEEPPYGSCGKKARWEFDAETGCLSIRGDGEVCGDTMYHGTVNRETNHCMPWYAYRHDITSVDISGGITRIGKCTFHGLSNLRSVYMDNNVTEIADYAFENCDALNHITLSENLKALGTGTFSGCTSLNSLRLPASIKKLGRHAFMGTAGLELVFLGDAPSFDDNAFAGANITAYYMEDNSTWKKSVLRNYGGSIVWKINRLSMELNYYSYQPVAVGEVIRIYLNASPDWITIQPNYSVSANMEVVEKDDTGIVVKACSAGYGSVRVTDDVSGKTDSVTFAIVEPIPITAPGSRKINLGAGQTAAGVYTFTPDQSGQYVFSLENIDDPTYETYIDITYYVSGSVNNEWVEARLDQSRYSFRSIVTLEAGESYLIRPMYSGADYHQDVVFSVDYAAPVTGIEIAEETRTAWICDDYYINGNWLNITADLLPGNAIGDIVWTCDDPSVMTIMGNTGTLVPIRLEKPGTAVVTATCGEYSDSVTVTVKKAPMLTLGVPTEDRFEFGNPKIYGFTAPEEGTYCFTVDTDTQMSAYTGEEEYWTQDGRIIVTMEKGQTHYLNVAGEIRDSHEKPYTVTVSQPDPATSMTLEYRIGYEGEIFVYPVYGPDNGYDWLYGVSSSDEDILECNYENPDYASFQIINDGEVTITAMTESGLTASETIYVGRSSRQISWLLDSKGTMTVYGWNVMPESHSDVWSQVRSKIQVLKFEGGITHFYPDQFTGTSAREIYLPSSLMDYGRAFKYSSQLEKITIPETNRTYATRDGVLFSKDMKTLLLCPTQKPGTGYDIPDGVELIEDSAFKCNATLETVTIPDSVTVIQSMAFEECTALKNIVIPASVTEVGENAFFRCESLESLTVAGNPNLSGCAFAVCTSLKELYFLGDAPTFGDEIFYGVTATAYYPANNPTWTEAVRQDYCGKITWVAVESRVEMDKTEVGSQTTVWVDGVERPVVSTGSSCQILIPDDAEVSTMITYSYHTGDPNDIHTQYPVFMKVWILQKQEDGTYQPVRVEALDDILQYSGSSIRVTGNKGIRMITSINQDKKTALVSSGLAGYNLVEYGTVLSWASDLEGGNPLVLGQPYAKSNYAYRKGVADPVFAYSGDLMQYTNVLVGFTNDQCSDDIAMRPYMILEDADGEQVTIYGGIVYRSIGYIAWQNRAAFALGTAAYEYVWDIIRHVYGSKYDAEYKG